MPEKGARRLASIYRFDAGLQGRAHPLPQLKKEGMEVGITDHDLVEEEVIPHLIKADVVVVSSLYYFGINAQLKTVIDRFYLQHQLKDKHSVILVSGCSTQDDRRHQTPHAKVAKYMRWPSLGDVYADDSWNQSKLSRFAQQAYEIGKQIK